MSLMNFCSHLCENFHENSAAIVDTTAKSEADYHTHSIPSHENPSNNNVCFISKKETKEISRDDKPQCFRQKEEQDAQYGICFITP